MSCTIILPKYFTFFLVLVHFAREDEQIVGQAVDVGQQLGGDFCLGGQRQDAAFGAAADGAADVAQGGPAASARQHEGAERGQEAVQAVYLGFQRLHLRRLHHRSRPQGRPRGVRGQLRADGKERVLHAPEGGGVAFVRRVGGQQAEAGVQFVHRAVGFQADVGFGDALAAHQRGGAGVAGTGVEGAFLGRCHKADAMLKVYDVILLGYRRVEEDDAHVEEVERDAHARMAAQAFPQMGHGGGVAHALDDKDRLSRGPGQAEAQGGFHLFGAAVVVHVEEVDRPVRREVLCRVRLHVDGPCARRLQVERRGGRRAHVQQGVRAGVVGDAEQQPPHAPSLVEHGPPLAPRHLPLLLPQLHIFIIGRALEGDALDEAKGKGRVHAVSPPMAEAAQPNEGAHQRQCQSEGQSAIHAVRWLVSSSGAKIHGIGKNGKRGRGFFGD